MLMIRSLLVSLIQPINTAGDLNNIECNIQLFTGIKPATLMPAIIMVLALSACCLLIIKGCAGIRQYGTEIIIISALVFLFFLCCLERR